MAYPTLLLPPGSNVQNNQQTAVPVGPFVHGSDLYGLFPNGADINDPPVGFNLNAYKSTDQGLSWAIVGNFGDNANNRTGRYVSRVGDRVYALRFTRTDIAKDIFRLSVLALDMATDGIATVAPNGPSNSGWPAPFNGSGLCPGFDSCLVAVRSNGDIVVVYVGDRNGSGFWRPYYAVYSGGAWGAPILLRDDPNRSHYPYGLVVTADDSIRVFCGSSTDLSFFPPPLHVNHFHHVTIKPDNSLGTYQTLSTDAATNTATVGALPGTDGTAIAVTCFSFTTGDLLLFTTPGGAVDPVWTPETLPFPAGAGNVWGGTEGLQDGNWGACCAYDASGALWVFAPTISSPLNGSTDTGSMWYALKSGAVWNWTNLFDVNRGVWLPISPAAAPVSGGMGLLYGIQDWFDLQPPLDEAYYTLIQQQQVPLAAACNNPPAGSVGVAYSHTLLASGGTPPYTFAVVAGALPNGLALDPNTGVISGTPTTAGTFAFTVRVTDSARDSVDIECSIVITQQIVLTPCF